MEPYDQLLRAAARRLKGYQRRLFQAEVATRLCAGSARAAERRCGWGRAAVATGLQEARHGLRCVENFPARARRPCEVKDPQLAADIRAIVEPYTHADPELKSSRHYTNLSAAEVRQALRDHYGYAADRLPAERTLRDVLNRPGYRRQRVQKAKPLKKLPETDAIFANVVAARQRYAQDPEARGQAAGRGVRPWGALEPCGAEGGGGAAAARGELTEVRHHHSAAAVGRAAGTISPATRLSGAPPLTPLRCVRGSDCTTV
jgi:hypothetical protein